ncbi:GNAT family N-acetyltransferase [Glaciibacter superstes]|uniref:GNAT family N-acetyltransferase n=1 Tax=Glaciibacter superstes TaxID=501023 RepID=UPI0012FAB3C4|nr:GNAT family N-acetyltransferase [Glaciibacter superstes]
MKPVELSSPLLRLDQPVAADSKLMFEYCQDPLFERFLTVPWPYNATDAETFISRYIPSAWKSKDEYTWALRAVDKPDLLGIISLQPGSGSIGFWLGAPHRGNGYVPEALRLVADWAFSTDVVDAIHWECLVGNIASARVARKAGFIFQGQAPSMSPYRDGSHPISWQGRLRTVDDRSPKDDWPDEVVAP